MMQFYLFFFQLKRLKLRKNNWDSDTYEFDEVFTEFASQKRVYEVVAKPVVEVCCSILYFLVTLSNLGLLTPREETIDPK